jgi:hypothetical protein
MFEEQELTEHDYNSIVELVFKPEGNRDPPFPTPPHKLAFSFTFKVVFTSLLFTDFLLFLSFSSPLVHSSSVHFCLSRII